MPRPKQILNISFIGYGNMAKAIAKPLLGDACFKLRAASPSLAPEINKDGITTDSNNLAILKNADVVIIAVKPNQMLAVLSEIKEDLPKECLLLSLAAGISLSWLTAHLPNNHAIVRCMPNIAVSVGNGATSLMANKLVNKKHKQIVKRLFSASGLTVWLDNENDMDVLTALSGSGPAYIFLFLDAMMKAAENLGLSKDLARTFSLQTLIGASHLAAQSTYSFSQLREQVTSPGGTTEAAIDVLRKQGIEQSLFKAMEAAYHKALALKPH